MELIHDVVRRTLTGFGERLAAFGPNLLAMIVLLALGMAAAGLTRLGLGLVLPRLGFDRFAQRTGLGLVLERCGFVRPASAVLAPALAWLMLGVFVLLAVGALDLQFAMDLLTRAFAYLPQVLVAGLLLVAGMLVAGLVERSVLIAAVNAGVASARLLARAARGGLLVLFVAMACEHLGVGRQVLLTAFAILFGGVVLALALAFGLAGRDLAREALGRMAARRDDARGETLDPL
jgi:hypothetical protein